jgi:hypothetical protein
MIGMAGNLAGNSRRRPFIGCGQRSCLPETARTAPEGRSVGQIVFGGRATAPLPISRSAVSRSCGLLGEPPLRIGWPPPTEPPLKMGAGSVVVREDRRHGSAEHVAAMVDRAATLSDIAEASAR